MIFHWSNANFPGIVRDERFPLRNGVEDDGAARACLSRRMKRVECQQLILFTRPKESRKLQTTATEWVTAELGVQLLGFELV